VNFDLIRGIAKRDEATKIVLLVLDGLGGLPGESFGWQTALEAAETPHLDALATRGICGLHEPVASGVTPGSGPAHLALFGYDPVTHNVGRGVLSALGIDFDLQPGDVAARGNFCTVDDDGVVTDRRAGRIPTDKNRELLDLLRQEVALPGVEVFLEPVKEYRFVLVLRGEGLDAAVHNTDPLEVGETVVEAEARREGAERTAALVCDFVDQVREALAEREPANMVLLRGFSQRPDWPTLNDVCGLKGLAIARYPMYRGVSKLVGMDALPAPDSVEAEFDALVANWDAYDFFFVHVKRIDSAGEDGDMARKISLIEGADGYLPRIQELGPDVLVVTGDHSTPAAMKYHSWHPVPVALWSKRCRPDRLTQFSERACVGGSLGSRFPAHELMALALAHAGRLDKYGA
jgi:2,3-bisphosphoglycerate-independent phosphoglycerate mutase